LELDFSLEQSTSSALTKPKTGEDVELASALKQIKQMEQRSEAEKANPLSKNPTSSSSSLPIKANENGTVKEKSPPRLTLGLDLL
jgi:hypothetical protein